MASIEAIKYDCTREHPVIRSRHDGFLIRITDKKTQVLESEYLKLLTKMINEKGPEYGLYCESSSPPGEWILMIGRPPHCPPR